MYNVYSIWIYAFLGLLCILFRQTFANFGLCNFLNRGPPKWETFRKIVLFYVYFFPANDPRFP